MAKNETYLDLVDPELRDFAARFMPPLTLNADTIYSLRKTFGDTLIPEGAPIYNQSISGRNQQPDINVLVINAQPGTQRPGILYMHGGGYVLGAASAPVSRILDLALELDLTIVSVDYRLAPETNYIGSMADNYVALEWLHAHSETLGVDRDRIAVMGDSAGGGHAVLVAAKAQECGVINISFQALIYPMLDDRTGSSDATPDRVGQVLWGVEAAKFGWKSFLGTAPGKENVPEAAVPARMKDISNLPPTFLAVGDLDLFCAEGCAFSKRLSAAGVSSELLVLPGAFHGFDLVAEANITQRYKTALKAALKRGLQIN